MKIERLLMIPDPENLERSIEIAQKYGCSFEYNDFYLPEFADDQDRVRERIEMYKSENRLPDGCHLHGAFLDVTVFSDDPKIVEVSDYRVEQSLSAARSIGAKAVIFHTNYMPNFQVDYYCKNWIERNASYWKQKLEKYKDINIYMENMFDMSYELLTQLAQRLCTYPNFGVCFDYAHAHAFGDEKQIDSWAASLAPYVKHLHINDNDLVNDLHLCIGEGRIDWKLFKKNYETYFPKASVLVEIKSLDAAEKSLEYIQKL